MFGLCGSEGWLGRAVTGTGGTQQPGSALSQSRDPSRPPPAQQSLFSHLNRSGEHTNGPDSSSHPSYLLFVGQQIFALYFKVVHPACGASPDLAAGVGSNRGGTGAVVWVTHGPGQAELLPVCLEHRQPLFLGGCCGLQYFVAVFPRVSVSPGLG